MAYTIATHNGSAVSRQHNLRNPKVAEKQSHIRKDGEHEIWRDVNPRQAYRQLFGAAQDAYNQKQLAAGRPGRCIKSYYDEVAKDAKKHVAYEMIVSIGNVDNRPDPKVAKEIFRKFVDTWRDRNGSLVMIGAYYHADEQGVPHVHIDYVPVATGYKNGMGVQNGLVKALNAIGFESRSARDTAQIAWERRENELLETLCRERGLEVDHPLEAGRKHMQTEAYKAEQALKKAWEDYQRIVEKYNKMVQEGNKRFGEYKATLIRQKEQIEAYQTELEGLLKAVDYQKAIYKIFGGDPKDLSMFMPDPGAGERDEEPIDFDELLRS